MSLCDLNLLDCTFKNWYPVLSHTKTLKNVNIYIIYSTTHGYIFKIRGFEVCSKNFFRIRMFTLNKPKKIAVNFTLQCKVDIYNFTDIPWVIAQHFASFSFCSIFLCSTAAVQKNSLQLFTFLYVWLTSMPYSSLSLAIHVTFAILHDFLQIEQSLIFFTHNIKPSWYPIFSFPMAKYIQAPRLTACLLDFIYLWEKKYRADHGHYWYQEINNNLHWWL